LKGTGIKKTAFLAGIGLLALSTPVVAESIPSGTYQAQFGNDFGVLTVGDTSLGYTFGPCGKDPVYTANKVTRRGDLLKIDQATYKFSINDKGHLQGTWKLNGYEGKPIFWKQP